jgi:hypothetical protein
MMYYNLDKMSSNKQIKEDFLEEDSEISSQKYVLLSFLSPENVLAKKELFFFERFLKDYEIQWKTKNLEAFLAQQVNLLNARLDEKINALEVADASAELIEAAKGCRIKIDDVLAGFAEYVKKSAKEIKQTKLQDDYSEFMFCAQEKLEDEFLQMNEFRTSVRGLKVRGVYSTTKEAEMRAKKLQREDVLHNIFVGEVGKWLPWDPSPNAIKEQEYAEDQLNELMKKYRENEEQKEKFYKDNKLQKPSKQIFGASDESAAEVTNSFEGMFGAAGDLALERKKAAAAEKDVKKD